MGEMKQVIVARADLGMSAGKLAAQACHASLLASDHARHGYLDQWRREGHTKVVLAVDSEAELLDVYKKASALYLTPSIICDEGRTEVPPGTITVVGIGPAPVEEVDKVTGGLRLYGK